MKMKRTYSCMFNHELLVTYVTRNVSPVERVTVESHLSHCPECQQEVESLQKSWLALDLWQEPVENARPRLNDLRLRLDAVKPKPSLWRTLQNSMSAMLVPLQYLPASPVLAVIVTGLFIVAGYQLHTESNVMQPVYEPLMASNPEPVQVEPQSPLPGMPSGTPVQNGQVDQWDMLARASTQSSNVLIRLATDGLDPVRMASYGFLPNRDVLSNYSPNATLRPASIQLVGGGYVRLE